MRLAFALVVLLAAPRPKAEALISLDVKDAPAVEVVRLLAEVAGFQAVFDPGPTCALTLKLVGVSWRKALDLTLRSCGLGLEEEGGILRVAPTGRLLQEASDRRRLDEERRLSAPLRSTTFRLSYARAEQVAPLLKARLAPRGDVTYDTRTNTLFVAY